MKDRIIFIDEGNSFIFSTEFSKAIQESDNYYVIVTREGLPNLPYSVEEIYGIRESGKYASLRKTYNEFYHIYNLQNYNQEIIPEQVIVEDSNSGYEFFSGMCGSDRIDVISAFGKSNIFSLLSNAGQKRILIIADGAAFGSEMDRITKLMIHEENIFLYLPESFEWIILKSGIIQEKNLTNILESPYEFIDSSEFFSWERFFTFLLIEDTKDSYLQYTKKKLNQTYLNEHVASKILDVMEKIKLI